MDSNIELFDQLTLTCKRNRHILTIQKAWDRKFKLVTTIKLVNNYLKLGLTKDHIKRFQFEDLVTFIKSKSTILVINLCFNRIYNIITQLYGKQNEDILANINIRIFMACYMITYYPNSVFENMGDLEQKLFNISEILLDTFDNICILIKSGVKFKDITQELTKNFVVIFFDYLKSFKEWKDIDEHKLSSRIKCSLIALYQARKTLDESNPLTEQKYKVEIDIQIKRLRNKLILITSSDTLKEFDRQQNIDPHTFIDNKTDINYNSLHNRELVLTNNISNEQLAHELLINPNFQFDENCIYSILNPIYQKTNELFQNASWDILISELTLPVRCYTKVLRILEEICNGVSDISKIFNNIESFNMIKTININNIKQQIANNNYGWNDCIELIDFIMNTIYRIQHVKRNNEFKEKYNQIVESIKSSTLENQPHNLCNALKFLLYCINIIKCDCANQRLQLISPVIKKHGIEYVRSKFQNKLDSGVITLEKTQNWIHNVLIKEISSNNIELSSIIDDNITINIYNNIHTIAFMNIITELSHIDSETCPETLLYDVYHILNIQTNFQQVISISILFITCEQILTKTQVDTQVYNKIIENFSYDVNFDTQQAISNISNLLITESSLTDIKRNEFLTILNNHLEPTNTVYQLLKQRMNTFWFKFVINGQCPVDMQFINPLKSLIPRIQESVLKIKKLIDINRNIHFETYKKILNDEAIKIQNTMST